MYIVCVYVCMCGCVGSAGASPPVTYVLSLVYRRHSLTPLVDSYIRRCLRITNLSGWRIYTMW